MPNNEASNRTDFPNRPPHPAREDKEENKHRKHTTHILNNEATHWTDAPH